MTLFSKRDSFVRHFCRCNPFFKCESFLQVWSFFPSVTAFDNCDSFLYVWPIFLRERPIFLRVSQFYKCGLFFPSVTHFCTCDSIFPSMTHSFKCDPFLHFLKVTKLFTFVADFKKYDPFFQILQVWRFFVSLSHSWKCDPFFYLRHIFAIVTNFATCDPFFQVRLLSVTHLFSCYPFLTFYNRLKLGVQTRSKPARGSLFAVSFLFAQCNPTWMRGKFGLKLQNRKKLPRIHARFHCNANKQS